MSRNKETITLSISPGIKEKLETIAHQHDLYWGKSPSISALIEAIATGELLLNAPDEEAPNREKIIRDCAIALINHGEIEKAKSLLDLISI